MGYRIEYNKGVAKTVRSSQKDRAVYKMASVLLLVLLAGYCTFLLGSTENIRTSLLPLHQNIETLAQTYVDRMQQGESFVSTAFEFCKGLIRGLFFAH